VTEESIVFDIGGYEGAWAARIAKRYNPHIYVFEPAPRAYAVACERLKGYDKAHVFNFGLGIQDGTFPLADADRDGASFYKKMAPIVDAKLVDIARFVTDEKIDQVDLCAINIEGGEYELLSYMIATHIVMMCRYLMVQFHNIIPGSPVYEQRLRTMLNWTHDIYWDYPGTWTAWVRRE